MKTSIPWIVSGILLIIVIILWVTRPVLKPDLTVIDQAEQRIKERDSKITELKVGIRALLNERREDSLLQLRESDSFKTQIRALQRRAREINTSKATAKDLDSILNHLYP